MSTESEKTEEPLAKDPRPKKAKKKPFFRGMLRGAGCGAAVAVFVLATYCVLVMIRATQSSYFRGDPEEPATLMGAFFAYAVCFGPPFLFLCTLLGAAIGAVRSRI